MARMICRSYDISDRSQMAPILEAVREKGNMAGGA